MKYFNLFLLILSNSLVYSQNDMTKVMIELDSRTTKYEVLKIDTLFSVSGEVRKIRYYNPLNKIRKSISFYLGGNIKGIFNVNAQHQLDGLSLDFYENGAIKHYGVYVDDTGFSYDYYKDGRIKKYSQSKDNYLVGYESSFCSEGELYLEIFHDSLDYTQKGYHCNGKLRFKGRIINNELKEGKWEYWNNEGVLIKEETWGKGELIETKEY